VVARENNEGVVELAFGAEVIEEAADLLVEQGHGRVVATQPLALAGLAQLESGLVQEGAGRQGRDIGGRDLGRELRGIVPLVDRAGRVPRTMRGMKSDRGKERPRFVPFLVEKSDRALRPRPVEECLGLILDAEVGDAPLPRPEVLLETDASPLRYGWFHVSVPCPDLPGLRVEVFLGVVDLAYGKRRGSRARGTSGPIVIVSG